MSGTAPSSGLPVLEVEELDIEAFPRGRITRARVRLMTDPLGDPVSIPVMVARGVQPGPVFGVTAAVHGNEVNGIPVIQRLFRDLDPSALAGTLVGVPVVSVYAFFESKRTFQEGFDLNRIMPGRSDGNVGQVYAHRFLTRVLTEFEFLIDLHTASFGRINSLYVRADLRHKKTRRMAMQMCPEIIVHNEARDGTVRDAAMDRGIPAITVEVGDPLRFQKAMIRDSVAGVRCVLSEFGMIEEPSDEPENEPVICGRSYWIYAQHGGLLDVLPDAADAVEKDQVLANVRDVYGDIVATYRAPEAGVIVGRSTNPICGTGSRVVHLGIPRPLADIIKHK